MEFKVDSLYHVKVIKIVPSGCVVSLDDRSTELIHLSNLSNSYVKDVSDFVAVGDEFEAKAIAGKVKSTELSLRYLDLQPIYKSDLGDTFDMEEALKKMNFDYKDKFGGDYPVRRSRKGKKTRFIDDF